MKLLPTKHLGNLPLNGKHIEFEYFFKISTRKIGAINSLADKKPFSSQQEILGG